MRRSATQAAESRMIRGTTGGKTASTTSHLRLRQRRHRVAHARCKSSEHIEHRVRLGARDRGICDAGFPHRERAGKSISACHGVAGSVDERTERRGKRRTISRLRPQTAIAPRAQLGCGNEIDAVAVHRV